MMVPRTELARSHTVWQVSQERSYMGTISRPLNVELAAWLQWSISVDSYQTVINSYVLVNLVWDLL